MSTFFQIFNRPAGGSNITFTAPTEFEGGSTSHISVSRLTDTTAIICYSDGGDSSQGKYVIVSGIGSTLAVTTPATFSATTTSLITVVRLTDTTAFTYVHQLFGDVYGYYMSSLSTTPAVRSFILKSSSTTANVVGGQSAIAIGTDRVAYTYFSGGEHIIRTRTGMSPSSDGSDTSAVSITTDTNGVSLTSLNGGSTALCTRSEASGGQRKGHYITSLGTGTASVGTAFNIGGTGFAEETSCRAIDATTAYVGGVDGGGGEVGHLSAISTSPVLWHRTQ
jgi:hypothetical protein